MENLGKWIGGIVGVLAVVFGLIWLIQGGDFFLYRFFAPKYEEARRETFEQSKAYQEGMVQELQSMQFEYIKAAPEQQDALASIILHRAADFPENEMPADLREFINKLKYERNH